MNGKRVGPFTVHRSLFSFLSTVLTSRFDLATAADPGLRLGLSAIARFFGHPRGLSTLFFTEMWERFSYYGMRAILILFMTAPVGGRWTGIRHRQGGPDLRPVRQLRLSAVGARRLGGRSGAGLWRAVFVGGVIIMMGHICLAVPSITRSISGWR